MIRFMVRPSLFWLFFLLVGCATKPVSSPTSPSESFLGTISMVNDGGQFVLIDFGGFVAPTPGIELTVRRAGEDVGILKTGIETRRPFAAADIVSGTPQPGDDVWSKNPTP